MIVQKNIIIYALDSSFVVPFREQISKNSNVKARFVADRATMVEAINQVKYSLIYMDESLLMRDINMILRAIANSSINNKTVVYMGCKNVANYKQLIDTHKSICLLLQTLPAGVDQIISNIIKELFPEGEGQSTKAKKYNVDTTFINVFVDSTNKVIKEFVGGDVVHGRPMLLSSYGQYPEIGIRGKIMIASEFFSGSFMVSFPTKTFLELYKKVVGEQHDAINKENADFAKEIANITYGKAKVILNNMGYNLDSIIPTSSNIPNLNAKSPVIVIPYTCSIGEFYVKIAPDYM